MTDDWTAVGARIKQARLAAELTQDELSGRIALARTALARVEGGSRQVSALELFRLADALDLPISHFVTDPPAAIVSQRRDLDDDHGDPAARSQYRLEAALQAHARDTRWLIDEGLLPETKPPLGHPEVTTEHDARDLAAQARAALDRRFDPHLGLGPLVEVCELFGLYLDVAYLDADGAFLPLTDGTGVAVIGGRAEPGRRRFTAAHELGHFLMRDEYTVDLGVATSRDDRESVVDAFAAEFLLPREAVKYALTAQDVSPRVALLQLAYAYRTSWSTTVRQAQAAGALGPGEVRELSSDVPVKGEFLAVLGAAPEPDLLIGATGPAWRKAVLGAWRLGRITQARTVELLKGAVVPGELPAREVEPAP